PIAKPEIGEAARWGEASKQGVVVKAGQHVVRLYVSRLLSPYPGRGPDPTIAFDNLRFDRSTLVVSQVISGSGQPGFADGPPDQARLSPGITGLETAPAGRI